MSTKQSEPSREYPLMGLVRERHVDPRNSWVNETYRNMVSFVIRTSDEALNVNQITEKVIEVHNNWPEYAPPSPKKPDWVLPKGRPTRKTVSKHLKELQLVGQVVPVGGLYLSSEKYIEKHANAFNQNVRQLLSSEKPENWNFLPAGSVAGCYIFSDPTGAHYRFQDLLHWQQDRFRDSLFWFDEILRYAISIGALSTETYSNHNLDMRLLKKGWGACFGEARLVVLAFAINPHELMEFLKTPVGRNLVNVRLEQSWNEIKSRGERDQPLYRNWNAVYGGSKK